MKVDRKTLFLPLTLFLVYIAATLVVCFWGPKKFQDFDRLGVGLYMTGFVALFAMGYRYGIRKQGPKTTDGQDGSPSARVLSIVKTCILIAFAVKTVFLVWGIASGGVNLSISEMGQSYVEGYEGYERNVGEYNLMFLLGIPFLLPVQATMVLGVYYFKSLGLQYRWLLAGTFLAEILRSTIGRGKQQQFGVIMVFLIAVAFLKFATASKRVRQRSLRTLAILAGIAVMGFVYTIRSRYEAIGIDATNFNEKEIYFTWMDFDHPFFQVFGLTWGLPLAILLTGYLSGGYYGLSLCMAQPFKWTYFLGSSYSVMVLFDRFLGGEFLLWDTYPLRMEEATGYPGMSKWHTIFPWLASDFTFIGALFVMAGMAVVYAICWKEAICQRNPVSILFYAVLTLGLIFVPANNQLMIAPDYTLAFWVLFILWLFKRRAFDPPPVSGNAGKSGDPTPRKEV